MRLPEATRTERLKSRAVDLRELATASARRDFRPSALSAREPPFFAIFCGYERRLLLEPCGSAYPDDFFGAFSSGQTQPCVAPSRFES
jgi:hypothetical protein